MDSAGWSPSGSCSLFVCDIVSFGAEERTDGIREYVRKGMYAALRDGFEGAGIPYAGLYREDRGDGALIAVQPHVDTALLITEVLQRVRAEVRRHNQFSSEAARLELRVGVHAGEVHKDAEGLVGTAVNHIFRLLDADTFKQALREAGAQVGLVVSERVYDEVVRPGRGLVDPDEYRPIEVAVKETETIAWIAVPPGGLPAGSPSLDMVAQHEPGPAAPTVTVDAPGAGNAVFEVVDRMLDIPLLLTDRGRQQVVNALTIEVAGMIPRSPDARSDIYAIITTCLDYPGGLQQLLQAIRGFVGDSMALVRLEQAITRLL